MIAKLKQLAAVAAMAVSIGAAQAATISINWTGTVLDGPDSLLASSWGGTLSFDDSFLDIEDEIHLSVANGLALTFEFRGQTFTHSDDTDFDSFPRITLINGVITNLNYLIVDGDEQGQELFDGVYAGVDAAVFNLNTFSPFEANGDGSYTVGLYLNEVPVVPEPATWMSMIAGLGLAGLRAGASSRRRVPSA